MYTHFLFKARNSRWRSGVGKHLLRDKLIRRSAVREVFGNGIISIAWCATRRIWQTAYVTSGVIRKKPGLVRSNTSFTKANSQKRSNDKRRFLNRRLDKIGD